MGSSSKVVRGQLSKFGGTSLALHELDFPRIEETRMTGNTTAYELRGSLSAGCC